MTNEVITLVAVLVYFYGVVLGNLTSPDTSNASLKIIVNPFDNSVGVSRPSYVTPTTAQVAFKPGVPPGWSRPQNRPTGGSYPWFITRPPIVPTRGPSHIQVTELPEDNLQKSANISSELAEITNSTVYPPGVSSPEPSIAGDPDRGFVDWFLGIVGIKPSQEAINQNVQHSVGGAPVAGCSKCTCGITYKHNRIVGGIETLVNEYTWMTALIYNNRFYCGGSLINSRYVLTAGHCVNGLSKDKLLVTFLDHDRSTSYETVTITRRIQQIIQHKSYGSGGAYNNDIGLLRLESDITFSDMIRPVCLPQLGRSFTGHQGTAVGWGATQSQGQVSNKLQQVDVPILSNIDCRKTGYGSRITDNMLCAGYRYGTKDSCQGDSGGPLHVINGSHHCIVGIVSWGEGCAEANYPGVYTRVNRYLSWIYSNTKDACYCYS